MVLKVSSMVRPFPILSLSFLTVLIVLVSGDVLLISSDVIAYVAEKLSLISAVPDYLKITEDWALPEIYGYVEWSVIIVSLLWLTVRESWFAPFRWAIVFLIVLIDDTMQVHETLGGKLAELLPFPAFLQSHAQDIGELMVFGTMGLLAVALTAPLFFSSDLYTRAISKRFGMIILFLVFFGVFLDFVHQLISGFTYGTFVGKFLPQIFAVLEDGGEMIVASFATAYVLTLPGLEPAAVSDDIARK
jgi:hypothetical protein